MLYEFLIANRAAILKGGRDCIKASSGRNLSEDELAKGVPLVVDQIIDVLRREEGISLKPEQTKESEKVSMTESAGLHGIELLHYGFTISQVVHAYGAVCQTITGLLGERGLSSTAQEYGTLARCLDDVIASAVTSFEARSKEGSESAETEHLGFLAHELRNALGVAVTTTQLLKSGQVGLSGRTAAMLERAHTRMRNLIDGSLVEVRLRAQIKPRSEVVRLADILDYVSTTAEFDASSRGISLVWTVEPRLSLKTDQQLLIASISNLVQNAIKYSRSGGTVSVSGRALEGAIVVDVADSCGGLPPGKAAQLFDPYVQASVDRSGLGLGLPIVWHAVKALNGDVSVRDIPGTGCVFTVKLPG